MDGRANVSFGTGAPVVEAFQQASRPRDAGVSPLLVDTEQGTMQLGLAQRVAAAASGTCLRLADMAATTLATAVRLSLSGWRSGAGPWLRAPHAATVGRAAARRPSPSCPHTYISAIVFICSVYPQGICLRLDKECTMLQSQRQPTNSWNKSAPRCVPGT